MPLEKHGHEMKLVWEGDAQKSEALKKSNREDYSKKAVSRVQCTPCAHLMAIVLGEGSRCLASELVHRGEGMRKGRGYLPRNALIFSLSFVEKYFL